MNDSQEVPIPHDEMANRLSRQANALDEGLNIGNFVLADICRALALLLRDKEEDR